MRRLTRARQVSRVAKPARLVNREPNTPVAAGDGGGGASVRGMG